MRPFCPIINTWNEDDQKSWNLNFGKKEIISMYPVPPFYQFYCWEVIIWSKEANLYAFPLQGNACICLRRIEIFRVNAENTILAHILRTQLIIHSRALCIYFENTIVYVIYHNNTYKYHSIHKLSSYYVVYT